MKQSSLTRAASIVAFLTAISKILGFIRETSLAAVFGATYATDAYLVARTIPYLLSAIISHALTTTFIPVYSHVRERNGQDAAFQMASTVLSAVGFISIVLVFFGEATAKHLVVLVAPSYTGQMADLTVCLSRIILPMMVFQLLSGIITGILQSDGEFTVPTAADLVQNIAIIISVVFFGSRHGIEAVAFGTLVGAVGACIAKVPALIRIGFRCRWKVDLRDPSLQRMLVLMLPAIIGAGANELNVMVDRMLASSLPEGRVAALNYANRLMNLAPGILGTSLVTVMYPRLANLAAQSDWKGFSESLVNSLSMIHFLLAPIAVGAIVLREPLVKIVYQRGAFDAVATKETAWALLFLGLGMAVFTMGNMVNRSFFALQDTRTPMIVGVVTVGINVVLNLILVGPLEQGGLALATTIASMCGLVVSLFTMSRKAEVSLPIRKLVYSVVRVLTASVIMGAVVWWSYQHIQGVWARPGTLDELGRVIVVVMGGAIIYVSCLAILQAPQLDVVLEVVRRISRGSRGQKT
ncbi:MAG: murein biosynthesis integral membrane protein MurJ [Firmicutes bacterium]|nr:murein biosynthesis integral membrane protein MurJ [Bacillota bacterium]